MKVKKRFALCLCAVAATLMLCGTSAWADDGAATLTRNDGGKSGNYSNYILNYNTEAIQGSECLIHVIQGVSGSVAFPASDSSIVHADSLIADEHGDFTSSFMVNRYLDYVVFLSSDDSLVIAGDANPMQVPSQIIGCPDSISAARTGYNSIRISWSKVGSAQTYEIYRRAGTSGAYEPRATVSAASCVYNDTNLSTGKPYYYMVRACRENNGTIPSGEFTVVKGATPTMSTPTIYLYRGKRKITAKWSAVPGAYKYRLYRSTKKYSGFKCIKTTSSRYYTNKKLRKGKRYYYKVRAYRYESGAKVYSSYSSVKSTKPR